MIKTSFNISKVFIAKSLISFYMGDDSLKNPMKMFLENGAIDAEVISIVLGGTSGLSGISGLSRDFLEIDLWLNGLYNLMSSTNVTTNIEHLLMDKYRGIKYKHYKNHFYEADLTEEQFDYLYPLELIIKEIKKSKPLIQELEYIHKLLDHKDFPEGFRLELYDATNNEYFLPKSAKDIFLF